MKKKWDKSKQVRFCLIAALILAAMNTLFHFGMGYIAGRRIQIIDNVAGTSTFLEDIKAQAISPLEEMKAQQWDDGQTNAVISAFLIYVLVVTRKKPVQDVTERRSESS